MTTIALSLHRPPSPESAIRSSGSGGGGGGSGSGSGGRTSPLQISPLQMKGTHVMRPPSPSAPPPTMFAMPPFSPMTFDRRASGDSERCDPHGRSQSAPMTRPNSPPPKRTNSIGNVPPFVVSTTALSPPAFHPTNPGTSTPESRRTRSSEIIPGLGGGSSPESSPHHSATLEPPYPNGPTRSGDQGLYMGQDYDAMMRPKKRHKTSRACDECRRKKIRCDATSEANVEQCSSCKRAGVNCSFSRVPMKRGPTKGLEAQYIRELEDRLVSLEYSVQTKGHIPTRDHSPSRRHGTYSGTGTTPPQIYKPTPNHQAEPVKLNPVLGSHPRGHLDRLPSIDAIHGSSPMSNEKRHSVEYFRQPFTPRHEMLPSHPYRDVPDRRSSVDQSRKMSLSFSIGPLHHERSGSFSESLGRRQSLLASAEKPIPASTSIPINDTAINRMKRLHSYLAAAPLHLRNALLHAVYALTATDQSPSTPSSPHSPPLPPAHIEHTLKACDLIGTEAFITDETSPISFLRNLMHLQILVLLALNADKRAFSAPSTENNFGVAKGHGYTYRFVGSMIGAAWGCANEFKLNQSSVGGKKRVNDAMESADGAGSDIDGEEALWRRAWWTLVILDRWRCVSTNTTPLISDHKIHLRENDRMILGETTFQLVRVSCVLGHVAEIPENVDLLHLTRVLNGELERVRETADGVLSQDVLLNVAFWYNLPSEGTYQRHSKLLVAVNTSDTRQQSNHALLPLTRKVVDILQSCNFNPNTPLIHHVIGFVTVVLVRLTSAVDTRDEAYRMLHDLIGERKSTQFEQDRSILAEGYDIITKRLLDYNHGRRVNEMAVHPHHRRESESRYSDSNGIGRLAHLADLAVGEGSDGQYPERQQYHRVKSELWRNIGGEDGLDGLVKRHGYLSVLQTLLQNA